MIWGGGRGRITPLFGLVCFLPKATEVKGRMGMSHLFIKPENASGFSLGKTPVGGRVK